MSEKLAFIFVSVLIFSFMASSQEIEDFQTWDSIVDSCNLNSDQKFYLTPKSDVDSSYPGLREYVRYEGEKVDVVNCSEIKGYYFVRKGKTVGDVVPDSNDSNDVPYWVNKALVILMIFGVKLSYDIYQKYG